MHLAIVRLLATWLTVIIIESKNKREKTMKVEENSHIMSLRWFGLDGIFFLFQPFFCFSTTHSLDQYKCNSTDSLIQFIGFVVVLFRLFFAIETEYSVYWTTLLMKSIYRYINIKCSCYTPNTHTRVKVECPCTELLNPVKSNICRKFCNSFSF